MALVPWRPFAELSRMRDDMDRLFEEVFGRSKSGKDLLDSRGWAPLVDMLNQPEEIVVRAQVPGMEKENINVAVSNGTLTISGERKAEEEVKEEDYYYSEHLFGKFNRTIELPTAVNSEKIRANLKNGILEVHLPKAEEVKPKAVPINIE